MSDLDPYAETLAKLKDPEGYDVHGICADVLSERLKTDREAAAVISYLLDIRRRAVQYRKGHAKLIGSQAAGVPQKALIEVQMLDRILRDPSIAHCDGRMESDLGSGCDAVQGGDNITFRR